MHPKVEVAENPTSTRSTAATKQAVSMTAMKAPTAPTVYSSVAPTTPLQAAAQSLTAAAHTQQKTPACADLQQTGRTDVAPH